MPGAHVSDRAVYIAEGARIEPGAYVLGPAYIGPGAVVRHGAFVRENVVMLSGSILGHACEAKHSLMLPRAAAPHFNYIGDSIVGHRVNLGAGTKLSNLTPVSEKDPRSVYFQIPKVEYDAYDSDQHRRCLNDQHRGWNIHEENGPVERVEEHTLQSGEGWFSC